MLQRTLSPPFQSPQGMTVKLAGLAWLSCRSFGYTPTISSTCQGSCCPPAMPFAVSFVVLFTCPGTLGFCPLPSIELAALGACCLPVMPFAFRFVLCATCPGTFKVWSLPWTEPPPTGKPDRRGKVESSRSFHECRQFSNGLASRASV